MADKSTPEQLKDKLLRAMRAKAVLSEKSRLLQQQMEDARRREENTDHIVKELLDRQRESNFMLHRANSVLHRLQETNLALSSEFTELVKELPAPNTPDWEQRVSKINDLFRRTGEIADEVQDEVFRHGGPQEEQAPEAESQPVRPEPRPEQAAQAQRPVQPEPAPAPGPVKVEEPEPDPIPVFEAVPVEEPGEDPVQTEKQPYTAIDAAFVEAPKEMEKEPEYLERVDRLFGKLTTADPPSVPDFDDTGVNPARSIFSGLKARFSRKPKTQQHGNDGDDFS